MEADKFQNIVSKLKTQKSQGFNSCLKTEKTDVPAQRQTGGILSYLRESQPFCSIQVFNLLNEPTHTREENLLYSVYPI